MKEAIKNLAISKLVRYMAGTIYIIGFLLYAVFGSVAILGVCCCISVVFIIVAVVFDWKFILPALKER